MTRAEWIKEIEAFLNKIEHVKDDDEWLDLLEEVISQAEAIIDARKEDLENK